MTVISDSFDGGAGLAWDLFDSAAISNGLLNLDNRGAANLNLVAPLASPIISMDAYVGSSGEQVFEGYPFSFRVDITLRGYSASRESLVINLALSSEFGAESPFLSVNAGRETLAYQVSSHSTAYFLDSWQAIKISIDSEADSTIVVDLDGDGLSEFSLHDAALDGFSLQSFGIFSQHGGISAVWMDVDEFAITDETDRVLPALTTEELASITQLWDKVTAVAGAYQTFGDGFGAAFKALTGTEFLSSAAGASQFLDARLSNALPDGAQDLLDTITDTFQGTRNFDDLLAAMRAHKGAGLSLVGLMNQTLQVIEGLDYATTALEAVGAIIKGDMESATGSAFELTAALASGAVVSHVIGSTTVTIAAAAIAGSGLGAVIVVGGVAVVVGFGAANVIEQIEDRYDFVNRIYDGTEGMMLRFVQMANEGWVASWIDTKPLELTASASSGELLFGRGGNDSLKGIGGEDTLVGSQGDDTLDGGGGADELRGGDDDDLYIVDHVGDRVVEGPFDYWIKDIDKVKASITYTLTRSVDNLTLTGDRAIDGTGNVLDNKIGGNDADNSLDGRGGADTLFGMGGDDFLVLDGADGAEMIYGGTGRDTLYVNSLYDGIVVNLLQGFAHRMGVQVTMDEIGGIEDVIGGLLDDEIIGNEVDNDLDGSLGRDTIKGAKGADTITGGADKDTLYAGYDEDADVFVFELTSDLTGGFGRETIYQFDLNRDVLDFGLVDANSGRDGNQAFKFADSAAAFSIWAKPLRGGNLEISGDVTGDGRADFVFKLVDLLETGASSPVTLQGIFVL